MVDSRPDIPQLSIVIPVYNGGESFQKCLDSVRHWGASSEVIVVADGDSDGSWKLAEDYGCRVIRLPASGGPARARNVGARAATGSIVLFIDADVELRPTTVLRTICAFQQHSEIAALIGSYDDAPGAENFLSQYKNLFHHYTHQGAREEASTFWGACGAIRKSVFLELGGFDESYRRPCIEDIELGYRIRQAGYGIRLCKHIQVKHLKHWTFLSLLRAEVFYRALPWTALLLRLKKFHPEQYRLFSRDLNLKWSSRLSVVLVYAIGLLAVIALYWSGGVWLAIACGIALLWINWPVYSFFHRKRGKWFALRVLPWHWLYFFYSGLAFAISWLRHYWQEGFGRRLRAFRMSAP
ncbi:MAG: glycosyltransferase [Cyanobacteria bacterium J06626_6]